MRRLNESGQAVIEYLIVFSFMALIGLNLMKSLGTFMSGTASGLGYALTQQLATGVCKEYCFFTGYKNQE
jgi:hypothetical protein